MSDGQAGQGGRSDSGGGGGRPSASRFLAWLLRPSEQHALGDLEEEYRERVRPTSRRVAAEFWFLREAGSLLLAILRDRLSQRFRYTRSEQDASGGGSVMGSMHATMRDVRAAARGLLRSPGYTLVIAGTLAVAIGATTTVFGVANAAFLRPLPYPDADRLVSIYSGSRDDPETTTAISPLDWRDFVAYEQVVEAAGVWTLGESVHLTDAEETRRLLAPRVSANLFTILGVQPALGRFFRGDEEVVGGDDTVVLSYGLWERAFGSDPAVIDRRIELDGRSYQIVGVAPRTGMLPRDAEVWRPLALGPEWYADNRWGWQFLATVARLTPSTGVDAASRALSQRLAEVNSDRATRLGQTRVVRSLYAERSRDSGPAILVLMAAIVAVLVMACANIVTVTLVRSERRLREFALRRALGSGGVPLARMACAETVILASLGALGSLTFARAGLRLVSATELEALAPLGELGIDRTVITFGLTLTVVTGLLIGVAPVFAALRADPNSVIRHGGGRGGTTSKAVRVRNALVVLQVSLTLSLLVIAGLSASAFRSLLLVDPGFDEVGVLTATIELPADRERIGDPSAFFEALVGRLAAIPGVTSAGATNFLPLEGRGWSGSFDVVDPDPSMVDVDPAANMRAVASGYFATVSIPLVEGRAFVLDDRLGSAPVAIVDETVARRYWPEGSPVGRRAVIGGLSPEPAIIIGVVGDVPDERLGESTAGHVYFPVTQSPQRRVTLVVKTDGDAAALTTSVRQAIREVDDRMPVTQLSTMESLLGESLAGRRLGLTLLLMFGAISVLVAGIGTYGVLAFTVAARTREIGTRMALGAAPGVVLRSVVGHTVRLWVGGSVIGVVMSVVAIDFMSRYVVGVDTGRVSAYVAALLALGVTAVASAALPAARAARVDPVQAMRVE